MGNVLPGQLPEFAAAQTGMSQKTDHIPFFWFADSEDLLVFQVIDYSHFRRVLIEHLDIEAWVWQLVMFGQPAAKAFQGSEVSVGCSVDIFLQNVVDVTIDVFGLEIGGINRGKGSKSFDDHFVMNLCARLITMNITKPPGGCLLE